jgi:hypothetical protein
VDGSYLHQVNAPLSSEILSARRAPSGVALAQASGMTAKSHLFERFVNLAYLISNDFTTPYFSYSSKMFEL